MIVPEHKSNWLELIFSLRGTIFVRIWKRLGFVVLVSIIVTWWLQGHKTMLTLDTKPFSLIALALSIFLGFRNNTSYDRFWEGRKLWGGVVNTSRTLCRRISNLMFAENDVDELVQLKRQMILATAAYPHMLRQHLRKEKNVGEINELVSANVVGQFHQQINPPIALLDWMGKQFSKAHHNGWVSEYHLVQLEGGLTDFTNLQGGCERIKSTPIPFAYNVLLHRVIAIYCLCLPFGIVGSTGWLTPVVVAIISYAFLGLEAIGDEIESPFYTGDNDLPLSAISTMIEANIKEVMGEEPPTLLVPDPKTRILH
jgi:ion channel-forming bestrophin family protein